MLRTSPLARWYGWDGCRIRTAAACSSTSRGGPSSGVPASKAARNSLSRSFSRAPPPGIMTTGRTSPPASSKLRSSAATRGSARAVGRPRAWAPFRSPVAPSDRRRRRTSHRRSARHQRCRAGPPPLRRGRTRSMRSSAARSHLVGDESRFSGSWSREERGPFPEVAMSSCG